VDVTFSIVAGDGSCWGVAVASKFLAVGSAVPAAQAGVGAIATQSLANLAYRPDGLAMLRDGRSAQQTLDALTAADERREDRQAGIVDADGTSATFTGSGCLQWAGGATGPSYAIQGNILTGPEVVDAMQQAWLTTSDDEPFARRLLAALVAGDRAGGDSRGRQSAAILVVTEGGGYGGASDVAVDLRVDDHPDPTTELVRLMDVHDVFFGQPMEDEALPLEGDVAEEIRRLLTHNGYDDPDLGVALERWMGAANLEERALDGRIDPIVLAVLRDTDR
jgi:uncharacterized Ntn-hydrolase superfamily protein